MDIVKDVVKNLLTTGLSVAVTSLVIWISPLKNLFLNHIIEIVEVVLFVALLISFAILSKVSHRCNVLEKELKTQKNLVSKTISKGNIKKLEDELRKEIEAQVVNAKKEAQDGLLQHEDAIGTLRGQVYRTLGQFWDSQYVYSTAFIWWIRAVAEFVQVGNEKMARLALEASAQSAKSIESGTDLNYKLIGEYQRLFAGIPDSQYKIEKDLLDREIKGALERKPEFNKT